MNTETLLTLARAYRCAQFYAHQAHNRTTGESFFSDHSFFGELYSTYENAYDSLVERVMGLGTVVDIAELTVLAAKDFQAMSDGFAPDYFFKRLLSLEDSLRKKIDSAILSQTQGTVNLLQGLADESEARTYKMKQRVK